MNSIYITFILKYLVKLHVMPEEYFEEYIGLHKITVLYIPKGITGRKIHPFKIKKVIC